MKFIKKLVYLLLLIIVGINAWMVISTKEKIYYSIEKIPYNEVGLVLGTSNKYKGGGENNFFKERIETAAQLFKAGKVDRLIVSGSNVSKYYNEPEMMRIALIEHGVPNNNIILDGDGIRTIESILNSKNKFGLDKVTIITQEFHGYRALYISNFFNINAQVMSTKRLPLKESSNVRLREFFARVKAVVDLYL